MKRVIVLTALAVVFCAQAASARINVGSDAPSFTAQTFSGNSISLSDYRGKYLLLDFFATW